MANVSRATPEGNAALAIRQVLLNNGCSIPLAVAREAAEAAAPHLAGNLDCSTMPDDVKKEGEK